MTPDQLRSALTQAQLTRAGLAALLGINTRTVQYWLAGTVPITRMAELAIERVMPEAILINLSDQDQTEVHLRPSHPSA